MVEKNGKISLLNTFGKTEYIYLKVILDGWLEDVMVNGYVCSVTSIYFEGSGRRWTDGGPLFQDYDVLHVCSGSSVTSVINKFFF